MRYEIDEATGLGSKALRHCVGGASSDDGQTISSRILQSCNLCCRRYTSTIFLALMP